MYITLARTHIHAHTLHFSSSLPLYSIQCSFHSTNGITNMPHNRTFLLYSMYINVMCGLQKVQRREIKKTVDIPVAVKSIHQAKQEIKSVLYVEFMHKLIREKKSHKFVWVCCLLNHSRWRKRERRREIIERWSYGS